MQQLRSLDGKALKPLKTVERQPWRHRTGQGLNTKMSQVRAGGLGISTRYVRVAGTRHAKNTQRIGYRSIEWRSHQ